MEIKERLEKARKYHQQAEDHLIAVNERINEAKSLCDDGGFHKFRERFCPELGKSQSYVLHAIAAGKKTLTEHRAEERKRKRKSRANRKAAAPNSGTVPEREPEDVPTDGGAETAMVKPAKHQRAIAPGNEAVRIFTTLVMELEKRTAKRSAQHFSTTCVPAPMLERLAMLLAGIANIKKSEVIKPTGVVLPNASLREEIVVKAERAVPDAAQNSGTVPERELQHAPAAAGRLQAFGEMP
jgi:hypothetical protein